MLGEMQGGSVWQHQKRGTAEWYKWPYSIIYRILLTCKTISQSLSRYLIHAHTLAALSSAVTLA